MLHDSTETTVLDSLTQKEGEALELAAKQFTNKEIARKLEISSRAVEERLRSARAKLKAPDRRSAARRYLSLLEACDRTTCGPSTVDHASNILQRTSQETAYTPPPSLEGSDRTGSDDERGRPTFLEAYDFKFGRVGRVYAVVGLSVLIGLLMIAGVTIAVVARMLVFDA